MQIAEVISKTIQGEGKYQGTVVSIIRLPGCNLKCKWCDTKWAQNFSSGFKVEYEELLGQLDCHNVIVTGGEPTLSKDFEELVERLLGSGYRVHIETNGTALKREWLNKWPDVIWAISPKLKSTGNEYEYPVTLWEEYLTKSKYSFLKFVVVDLMEDLNEIVRILNSMVKLNDVFIQPVDNNIQIFKDLMEVGPTNVRYSCQLHKLMEIA